MEQTTPIPPHPRREPRYPQPLTAEGVADLFGESADFQRRPVLVGGGGGQTATLYYLAGMVRTERANDYILRPLAQERALLDLGPEELMERLENGGLYTLSVTRRETTDQVVFDLVEGCCVLFFPGLPGAALSCSVPSEEKRSVSDPEDEPAVKGAKDAFVESLRTNTGLVRRRLRTPALHIEEHIVGRQTVTPVDILWIEDIAHPAAVAGLRQVAAELDIDALLASGQLEQYLPGAEATPFPQAASTQRPDRFCAGLCEGRVGVLVDGLPLGWLLPATVGLFFQTEQDKGESWAVVSTLVVLRYLCVLVSLLLPACYIAAVTFHPELLPTRLALSILAAKADVPFSTIFEVLILLTAFEVLQEAGLRLPSSLGLTVSILGGLVVGQAAVEARIVSPAVLIVVAVAGVAGYTVPSQDFAGALRLWRFGFAGAASLAGLLGVALVLAALGYHLAGLESFGAPYLAPFSPGGGPVVGQPLPAQKLRPPVLGSKNRRSQA